MNRLVFIIPSLALFGCTEKDWTEGFRTGGFQNEHCTSVKYVVGGPTTFRVSIESDASEFIQYPVTLQVYLNGSICDEPSTQSSKHDKVPSVVCSTVLGPGMHEYRVKVINPNNFSNLSNEDDLRFNSIIGSITYTLEDNIEKKNLQ